MKTTLYRFSTFTALALAGATALLAQPRITSAFGEAQVQGRRVIVHVWVTVPAGMNENAVTRTALREQGARPFASADFTTTGLVWDQFSDGNNGTDFVTQNYNPANDPTNGDGLTALQNTHATWTGVGASNFSFDYGGTTSRCPSLVKECHLNYALRGAPEEG